MLLILQQEYEHSHIEKGSCQIQWTRQQYDKIRSYLDSFVAEE